MGVSARWRAYRWWIWPLGILGYWIDVCYRVMMSDQMLGLLQSARRRPRPTMNDLSNVEEWSQDQPAPTQSQRLPRGGCVCLERIAAPTHSNIQSHSSWYSNSSSTTILRSSCTCTTQESHSSRITTKAYVRSILYRWTWLILAIDILNRLRPAYLRQPKISPHDYVDPDPRLQAEQARNLSKYVFPRQYGLSNAFERSTTRGSGWVVPDFEDRDNEIRVWFTSSPLCTAPLFWDIFLVEREMQNSKEAERGGSPAREDDLETWEMWVQTLAW